MKSIFILCLICVSLIAVAGCGVKPATSSKRATYPDTMTDPAPGAGYTQTLPDANATP